MNNPLFSSEKYKKISIKIRDFINGQADFLSPRTMESTRAIGDAMQDLLADNFGKLLKDEIKEYSAEFARRAMADLAFTSNDNFYHIIDVKTHRLDTTFNMPNLTSVERLARFYEDDKNYFVVLLIAYNVKGAHIEVDRVHFVPIEFLDWSCLTIGALGWGQIQIANSNNIKLVKQSRKKWMLQLCDRLFEFYPNEIGKIKERIEYFKKVKSFWQKKKI